VLVTRCSLPCADGTTGRRRWTMFRRDTATGWNQNCTTGHKTPCHVHLKHGILYTLRRRCVSSIIVVGAVSVRPSVGACVRHAAYAKPREHTHTQVVRFRNEKSQNVTVLLNAGCRSEPIRSPLCHDIPVGRGEKTHISTVARIPRNSSAGKSQTGASLR